MRRFAEVALPRRFATVVTSAAGYPLDKTYYQTVKGMVGALGALADGGDLIVASECSEGLGSAEYRDAQRRLVEAGPDAFLAGIQGKAHADIDEWQTQMQTRPLARGRVSLFAEGLSPAERTLTGVGAIASVEAAVAESIERHRDPRIAIIRRGRTSSRARPDGRARVTSPAERSTCGTARDAGRRPIVRLRVRRRGPERTAGNFAIYDGNRGRSARFRKNSTRKWLNPIGRVCRRPIVFEIHNNGTARREDMKMLQATVAGAVAAVLGTAAMAGELTIATVNNGHMIEMQKLTSHFEEANPGITVNWVTLEEGTLRQRVTTDITTKGGQFDVMTIGMYEAPIWGARGWLEELEFGADYEVDDLLPAMRGGLSANGKLYAAPFYGESSMIMYRKDLVEAAGMTMPDNPTWGHVADVAAAIHDGDAGSTVSAFAGSPDGATTRRS